MISIQQAKCPKPAAALRYRLRYSLSYLNTMKWSLIVMSYDSVSVRAAHQAAIGVDIDNLCILTYSGFVQ